MWLLKAAAEQGKYELSVELRQWGDRSVGWGIGGGM